ncbi:MAG: lytic transglycosylase, partial [Pseudoxanthomonas sp.]|nr:lytic transglycosylase [Pseudoxanthomonas sp.]
MAQATTPATTPAAAPAAAAPEQPPSAEATGVAAAAAANAEPGGNGLAVLDAFIDGLAEPGCDNAEPRWLRQFAHAVDQVGDP